METTRPTLLSRVRDSSNAPAWFEFERLYGPLIVRYARRAGLQQSDAEDVRQLVMMNLSRRLRSFSYEPGRGRFRDYVGQAVRNAIHRELSRPGRAPRPLSAEEAEDLLSGDLDERDEAWETEWMQHHLRLALGSLRRTFEPTSMTIFEDLLAGADVASVAAEHETTAEAVHKVKQRVRKRLREILASQVHDEELPRGD